MTPKHFINRIHSYDLPKINYTKKLKKKKENCALPLLPWYAGTRSRTYGECEKHMYKKHTNCILCDQIGRSYSQPHRIYLCISRKFFKQICWAFLDLQEIHR
jgi:hypothetical protein